MTFGDQLKSERERLGIIQQATADILSIPKRTYCDWEYGITTPPEVAQEGALARLRQIKTPRR